MNIYIRNAMAKDIDEIECLYNDLNDYLAGYENGPKWKKGYPSRQHAEAALTEGTLYVAVIDEKIAGAAIFSCEQDEVYKEVTWQIKFNASVFVIEKLAVHPKFFKLGVAQSLLNYAVSFGRERGIKAIHLDTYIENYPAINLYEKCGFKFMGVIDLGLEELYGLKWYNVYEKLV